MAITATTTAPIITIPTTTTHLEKIAAEPPSDELSAASHDGIEVGRDMDEHVGASVQLTVGM